MSVLQPARILCLRVNLQRSSIHFIALPPTASRPTRRRCHSPRVDWVSTRWVLPRRASKQQKREAYACKVLYTGFPSAVCFDAYDTTSQRVTRFARPISSVLCAEETELSYQVAFAATRPVFDGTRSLTRVAGNNNESPGVHHSNKTPGPVIDAHSLHTTPATADALLTIAVTNLRWTPRTEVHHYLQ